MKSPALKSDPTPVSAPPQVGAFSPYQKKVAAILAFLQFTIILDFMILSPLGAMLLKDLNISTRQFGWVVSCYAFSAGLAGFLSAGFADRYDRKKMLLFFYGGFLFGTLMCGLAPSYPLLIAARILTGLFGGVIGSIVFAIMADLFPFQMRGRVMGVVQTAFAGSQVLGIPLGLFLANRWGWHMPFLLILAVGVAVGLVIFTVLKPIDGHLHNQAHRNPFQHLWLTLVSPRHARGYVTTVLLVTGGFMLMPFSSAFSVHNLGVSMEILPWVYLTTGVVAIAAGPLIGKLADRIGKFKVFMMGSLLSLVMVLIYCHLGITPLWIVMAVNAVLFIGISGRMIPGQALMSAIPSPENRGSFMSVNSSIQQISGGVASYAAGVIVVQTGSGRLEHYDILGYVVAFAMFVVIGLMYTIHKQVGRQEAKA
jgi:predicted MFS family arabinose efflux permease